MLRGVGRRGPEVCRTGSNMEPLVPDREGEIGIASFTKALEPKEARATDLASARPQRARIGRYTGSHMAAAMADSSRSPDGVDGSATPSATAASATALATAADVSRSAST